MRVQTIQMDKQEARKAFLAYRGDVRTRHTEEEKAVMRGYVALSRGQQLLDLHVVLRTGGFDAQQRPQLAVARADWIWCHFRNYGYDRRPFFASAQWIQRSGQTIPVPRDAYPQVDQQLRALVPSIPPPLRPAGNLRRYHILFEPRWEPVPPVDPMLLRHLSGTLYVVVASWNLTELERAVLAGRI